MRDLGAAQLQAAFAGGDLTPASLIEALHPLLEASGGAIVHLLPLQSVLERCR